MHGANVLVKVLHAYITYMIIFNLYKNTLFGIIQYTLIGLVLYMAVRFVGKKKHLIFWKVIVGWLPGLWSGKINNWMKI